jgi:LPXTG-motif cell wall-anchored protein
VSKSIVGGARVIVAVAATVVLTMAVSGPVRADDDILPDPAPSSAGAAEPAADVSEPDVSETDVVEAEDVPTDVNEPAASEPDVGTGLADENGPDSGPGVGVDAEVAEAIDPAGDATGDAPVDQPGGETTIDQSTEVTGTAIAVATTGNNTAVGTGAATTTTNAVSITSGSSTAAGNHEQTQVTQAAVTTLSGNAAAEIVQISIVFNIGGAYAASGGNGATSIGSGGTPSSTQTGTGIAIGNDSETYVTQAANATTAGAQSASVTQQTVTLQFGVATATTGGNSIITTVSDGSGGAATITTGDASAVGNESETSVEQVARAVGSGDATLTIEQWATIINLGVALANTGSNQIGDMIAAAWAAPDGDAAEELFGILLPALLVGADDAPSSSSGLDGGGSGSITTGDGQAIGNRSTTEVQQVAVAVASGDSAAHIRQEVVVVNAGVAIADTGHNRTDAGTAPATLSDAEKEVLDQLATFVAGLLAEIGAWADGTDSTVESSSLTAQLGDQLIGIGGDLSTSTGQMTTATGVLANIRQLTAVINLGLAIADSGGNVAITVDTQGTDGPSPPTAAVSVGPAGRTTSELSTGHVVIVTGDAIAANRAVIIVCQRANMADHPCLAPDEPADDSADGSPSDVVLGAPIGLAVPPPSSMVSATAPAGSAVVRSDLDQPAAVAGPIGVRSQTGAAAVIRSLPATGGDPTTLVLIALGALLTGSALLVVSRQRRL